MENLNLHPSFLDTLQQFITSQGVSAEQSLDKLPAANMEMIAQMLQQSIPQAAVDATGISTEDGDSLRVDSPESETGTGGSGTDADRQTREASISRPYRVEPWYECFATTSQKEFEALIYSLYVIGKNNGKLDGYEYYECINRLQNKCRYKVRCKTKDEFFIVEEKGGHNHAIEPVGQAGSHAGLPKTLREIVDRAFNEDWPSNIRQEQVAREVERLGLPPNPRLNRQIDNRIAYLRRVKNLQDAKKIQDQTDLQDPNNLASQAFIQNLGFNLNDSPMKLQDAENIDNSNKIGDDEMAQRKILEIMQAAAGMAHSSGSSETNTETSDML